MTENFILAAVMFAAALGVWMARWPQSPFDWLALAAVMYLGWSATELHRWDLVAAAIFLTVCVSRAELHRNGVAMPRMWWRD